MASVSPDLRSPSQPQRVTALWPVPAWWQRHTGVSGVLFFMPWYFIPRVLKLANTKMYVRNNYDGDSETLNVLATHTALKRWIAIRKYVGYRNVVYADRLCKAWLFCRFLLWGCELRLTRDQRSLLLLLLLLLLYYYCLRPLAPGINESQVRCPYR